jgi:hypothetical protein
MSSFREWIFRGLVIIAIGLLFLSWFTPWWNADVLSIGGSITIHPWGLESNLGYFATYMTGADMPVWFAPMMWIYLGLCVAMLLASFFVKERVFSLGRFKLPWNRLLIGVAGFSYIIVVVTAFIYASISTGKYGIQFVGRSFVKVGPEGTYVESGLLWGYWLACAVGLFLVLLALARNKIVGKPK